MSEQSVVRQNAGRLFGQRFKVTEGLICSVKDLAEKWEKDTDKKVAQMIINGIPMYELSLFDEREAKQTTATLTKPGGKQAKIPVRLELDENGHVFAFLNTAQEIKTV
ncbi:hypothetical protein ACFL2U_02820 [Patescibacteria group bacterium]